jgi:hypothetical protein
MKGKRKMAKRKSARTYIERKLSFEVGDLIRQHCHLKDGFADYDPDWSDGRIVAEFPTGVTIHHVKAIRLALVGSLAPARAAAHSIQVDQLQKRISELEAAVRALEKWTQFDRGHAAPSLFMTEIPHEH